MTETFTPDNLYAGDYPVVTDSIIVASGAGSLPRGRVLGRIDVGTVPTTGTADVGNTGDGTVTVVTGGVNTLGGIYTITCIEAVTNGGVFNVINPSGKVIGTVAIDPGAGQTGVFTSDEINFTVTDGATDFAYGDFFTVTVPAGSGKYTSVDSTAIDGSDAPVCVLLEAVDATAADVTTSVALSGEFDDSELSVGGSDTVAQHKDAMRALNMYQKTTSVGGLSV